jgi:hypothetical protein
MSTLAINSETTAAPCKARAAGRAVWLVLGWLAFWLGTVAYPCQAHPVPSAFDQTVAFEVATSQPINPAYPDSHPAHDEGTCHYLSAPLIGAPLTAAADSGNPNAEPVVAVALERYPATVAVSMAGIRPVSQAFPHTPLFLRTQRLLI